MSACHSRLLYQTARHHGPVQKADFADNVDHVVYALIYGKQVQTREELWQRARVSCEQIARSTGFCERVRCSITEGVQACLQAL